VEEVDVGLLVPNLACPTAWAKMAPFSDESFAGAVPVVWIAGDDTEEP